MAEQPTIIDQVFDAYSAAVEAFLQQSIKDKGGFDADEAARAGLAAAAPHIAAQHSTDLEAALDSVRTVMALSSRDWSTSHDVAWLWGILVGWDDDPTAGDVDQLDAMSDLAAKHRWSSGDVARLRRLRSAIEQASRPAASQS